MPGGGPSTSGPPATEPGRGDNANLDELKNHVGVTAVCAVNYQDVRASYSDIGANLWVCAPSGETAKGPPDTTTTGNGNRYDSTFAGTSAAAPVVSGVAALVRAANNQLTWRDVKLILAGSARKNHPSSSGWQQGALKYGSTSERYSFNHEYGFGVVGRRRGRRAEPEHGTSYLPCERSRCTRRTLISPSRTLRARR